jgi:hypothetical protein
MPDCVGQVVNLRRIANQIANPPADNMHTPGGRIANPPQLGKLPHIALLSGDRERRLVSRIRTR